VRQPLTPQALSLTPLRGCRTLNPEPCSGDRSSPEQRGDDNSGDHDEDRRAEDSHGYLTGAVLGVLLRWPARLRPVTCLLLPRFLRHDTAIVSRTAESTAFVARIHSRMYSDATFHEGGGVANSKSEIRNSKSCQGEELPRGSLDPGGSFKKVGIMVGVNGRNELVGGRNPAGTRWACRRPQKPSGLPRHETSRDSGTITTWQCTHTQYSCPEISLENGSRGDWVAQPRVTMSRFGNGSGQKTGLGGVK